MALGAIVSGLALLLQGLDDLSAQGTSAEMQHSQAARGLQRTAATDRVLAHHYKWHEKEADRLLSEADAAYHAGEQLGVALRLAAAKPHVEGMEGIAEHLFSVGTGDRARPRYRRRLERLEELAHQLEHMAPSGSR